MCVITISGPGEKAPLLLPFTRAPSQPNQPNGRTSFFVVVATTYLLKLSHEALLFVQLLGHDMVVNSFLGSHSSKTGYPCSARKSLLLFLESVKFVQLLDEVLFVHNRLKLGLLFIKEYVVVEGSNVRKVRQIR